MPTILLADDTALTLTMAKAYLESRNLRVFATDSALKLIELARLVRPDLIVLDYEMPEMNGDSACGQLKHFPETSEIPVVILTGHDVEKVRERCMSAGAVGVLSKADGRESLLGHVAAILGLPQRRHMRVSCHLTIGFSYGGLEFRGIVRDISESGLYLVADTPLEERAVLQLKFTLPILQKEVSLLAETVRTDKLTETSYGSGVQFLEGDESTLASLREFMAKSV